MPNVGRFPVYGFKFMISELENIFKQRQGRRVHLFLENHFTGNGLDYQFHGTNIRRDPELMNRLQSETVAFLSTVDQMFSSLMQGNPVGLLFEPPIISSVRSKPGSVILHPPLLDLESQLLTIEAIAYKREGLEYYGDSDQDTASGHFVKSLRLMAKAVVLRHNFLLDQMAPLVSAEPDALFVVTLGSNHFSLKQDLERSFGFFGSVTTHLLSNEPFSPYDQAFKNIFENGASDIDLARLVHRIAVFENCFYQLLQRTNGLFWIEDLISIANQIVDSSC
jgi:hypothetical protein